jgi:hypothetical protein
VFERFTEPARQVVVLAQEEARLLVHNYIGTEHLLLGLLREEHGVAAQVLQAFDITVERVRGEVTRIVGSGEEVTSGEIPFTPRAKKVLELALREALSLGNNHIGTEHLLLALVRENDGVATRILLGCDADAAAIRDAVNRMLFGPSGRPHQRVEHPVARAHPMHPPRMPVPPMHPPPMPRPALDWHRATMHWRPEGLELRIPLHLNEGAMATFAGDQAWTKEPLVGLRRELWNGWLALASPTLLETVDPVDLRHTLDAAVKRALDVSGRERGRVEDFLHRLRDDEGYPA